MKNKLFTPFAALALIGLMSLGACAYPIKSDSKAVAPATNLPKVASQATEAPMGSEKSADEKLAMKINEMINRDALPGMVLTIMHKNELVFEQAFGYADRENRIPMEKDNIFRLFSMTKPITALATLSFLYERDYTVETPLQTFYPEFDSQSPMSMHTLLNHTSGLSYGFKINRIAGWQYLFSGVGRSDNLVEFMDILSGLPLLSEPGVRWRYSFSSDVQGAVIERVTNNKLQDYFDTQLFTPLDMKDTTFYLTSNKVNKLVPMYSNSWFSKEPSKNDIESHLTDVNVANSGGAGLLSTAGDYMKFLHLLLYPEQYSHIVDSSLVDMMLTNQLEKGIQGVPERLYSNSGFGYGIGVKLEDEKYLSKGSVYWAGKGGTAFWIDRDRELAVVAMMQMEGGNRELEKNLVPMVYEWLNAK